MEWKKQNYSALTFAVEEFGGLKMMNYESMVSVLRLSWLKRIPERTVMAFGRKASFVGMQI